MVAVHAAEDTTELVKLEQAERMMVLVSKYPQKVLVTSDSGRSIDS